MLPKTAKTAVKLFTHSKKEYWEMSITNPVVNKVFNDLEEFHDYCRTEGYPFNEADLYKNDARVWQAYQKYKNWVRAKNRSNGKKR
jgi:hypothetical protein